MTAPHDLDRQLSAYLMDGPTELPDPSFDAVRDNIETMRQRVFIGPWRFPDMNKFVAIGLSAAAVVVALVVGMQFLPTAPGGVGAAPSASPSPTPAPTPQATAAAPSASAATGPTPPPLRASFTSTQNGISLSYPEGWTARAATEPWTESTHSLSFSPGTPYIDFLYDPILTDHLFLHIASQPIGDATPGEWAAQMASDAGCAATEPITVDGASGLIGAGDCQDTVVVTTAGRGYLIQLYTSDDDPAAVAPYDRAWFAEVLAAVQLHPEDAVDVAPSAAP
jgi:hypothetical protein